MFLPKLLVQLELVVPKNCKLPSHHSLMHLHSPDKSLVQEMSDLGSDIQNASLPLCLSNVLRCQLLLLSFKEPNLESERLAGCVV